MDLPDLLATPWALPSLPRALALLSAELALPAPDLRRLNELMASDPALTARLLTAANAMPYQLSGRIGSIGEALIILPLPRMLELLQGAHHETRACAALVGQFRAFWVYSQKTARVARALATMVRHNPAQAYAAGLIHALGEWVLYCRLPDRMAALDAHCPPLALHRSQAQMQAWGFAYPQLTAAMARGWQWPDALVEGLQQMQAPLESASSEPLAGLLHLAAWRVRAQQAGSGAHELAVTFPGEVGAALGLDIDMVLQQAPIEWA